jgi:hypothetical protein
MKDDLQLRPIYHQLEQRIEAHIFVAFLAYCLHVTLRARLIPAFRTNDSLLWLSGVIHCFPKIFDSGGGNERSNWASARF